MTSYQLFPNLTADEIEGLTADIKARGVMVPVELDDEGHILDGHHRVMIADSLGIGYPTVVREGWAEDQKLVHVVALNAHRRHLTADQRAEVVATLRKAKLSTRAIARAVGVGVATVHRDLAGVPNGTGETVAGADGKTYPARRPTAGDLPLTDAHAAKFPALAAADLRVQLSQAMYAFGKPGAFNPEDWADRIPRLRPEDLALLRQHMAYIHRWLDKWDRLLDRPVLAIVEGSPE